MRIRYECNSVYKDEINLQVLKPYVLFKTLGRNRDEMERGEISNELSSSNVCCLSCPNLSCMGLISYFTLTSLGSEQAFIE